MQSPKDSAFYLYIENGIEVGKLEGEGQGYQTDLILTFIFKKPSLHELPFGEKFKPQMSLF